MDEERVLIDIADHVKSIQRVIIQPDMLNFDVDTGPVHVKCRIPSLARDITMNDNLVSIVGTGTDIDLTKTIGDIYVNEIIKYISSITYNKPDQQPIHVEFDSDIKGETMVKLFDALPMNMCIKTAEHIERIKEIDQQLLQSEILNGAAIPVDANIFNNE